MRRASQARHHSTKRLDRCVIGRTTIRVQTVHACAPTPLSYCSNCLWIGIRGEMPGAAQLATPKRILPNSVVAGILASFTFGTYWWSMHSVGQQDIELEVQREVERQQAAAAEQAGA